MDHIDLIQAQMSTGKGIERQNRVIVFTFVSFYKKNRHTKSLDLTIGHNKL